VFTSIPKNPPLPNATFGSFPAACHYVDGTFVPEPSQADCPTTAPGTGAAFFFWHPKLFTMHFWVWYPNPAGLYSSMNPLVPPFTAGSVSRGVGSWAVALPGPGAGGASRPALPGSARLAGLGPLRRDGSAGNGRAEPWLLEALLAGASVAGAGLAAANMSAVHALPPG